MGLNEPVIFQRQIDDKSESNEKGEYAGDEQVFVVPEDRKLGFWGTSFLIINRMVGTGIFSTPSTIMQATNSVGAALLFWVLGGLMSLAGLMVYLEFGMAIPRSGGEKVYLERIFRRPRYLATCVFMIEFVCFSLSAANTVNFSAHIIRAVKGAPEKLKTNCGLKPDPVPVTFSVLDMEWVNKGISIATITVICLIHGLSPKLGIWLSNGLGAFKMIILILIVFTGFAALAGRVKGEKPDNFSTFDGAGTACELPPYAKTTAAANYAIAVLQILYSFSGWESANYVLTEVKNAPQTLKKSAPAAVGSVTLLYILANIAYFAASTKSQIANSGVTVAAGFFINTWGDSSFVTRGLPTIIALSSLGNSFAQTYANSRVKQEFAKEGLLPFSRFWASNWPFGAPTGGILLHWLVTVIIIIGPRVSDAYPFVTNLSTYAQSWIKGLIGAGLLYLTWSKTSTWKNERKEWHAWPPATIFWLMSLLFVIIAPFFRNTTVTPAIPWFVVPTVGSSTLVLGTLYWFIWAKIWPMFGYAIEHEIKELPDGSEVVRYVHVRRRRESIARF